MIISKDEFLILHYLEDNDIAKVEWQYKSAKMTIDDFKKEILRENDFFLTHKPRKVLGQTQNFNYCIDPETQEWHNSIIIPTFTEIELKKTRYSGQ